MIFLLVASIAVAAGCAGGAALIDVETDHPDTDQTSRLQSKVS